MKYPAQAVNKLCVASFMPYIRKELRCLDGDEILDVLKNSQSAVERIVSDVIGLEGKILLLSDDEEEAFASMMDASLSERERGVLYAYYGLGTQPQTYEQIGRTYNVTRERVRQVLLKSLRKLRLRKRLSVLLPEELLSGVEDLEVFRKDFERYGKIKELSSHETIKTDKGQKLDIVIDGPDGWERALRKNSCVTWRDVFKLGLRRIVGIADEEGLSIQELVDGFPETVPCPISCLTSSVRDLDFSVRTMNCLLRANLKTVEDVCRCDDLIRVRNLGRKGVNEVEDFLKRFQ